MHFTKKNPSDKRVELRDRLKRQKILRFPGAYNPLTAKLISEIGFDGIYISGAVMANDLGVPDIGIMNRSAIRGPFLLNPGVHDGFDVWGRRRRVTGIGRSCDHHYGSQ